MHDEVTKPKPGATVEGGFSSGTPDEKALAKAQLLAVAKADQLCGEVVDGTRERGSAVVAWLERLRAVLAEGPPAVGEYDAFADASLAALNTRGGPSGRFVAGSVSGFSTVDSVAVRHCEAYRHLLTDVARVLPALGSPEFIALGLKHTLALAAPPGDSNKVKSRKDTT